MENFASVQRPAVFSWEALARLSATEQEAQPIPIDFPQRMQILSAYPHVAVCSGDDSLAFPTLDDLLVSIEFDTGLERRLTSRFDETTLGGAAKPPVTLGSFRDTNGGARVMNFELGSAGSRPRLQCLFSWKRSVVGGPWFQDVFVGLTFHCNPI
jgi:hypothetical protein